MARSFLISLAFSLASRFLVSSDGLEDYELELEPDEEDPEDEDLEPDDEEEDHEGEDVYFRLFPTWFFPGDIFFATTAGFFGVAAFFSAAGFFYGETLGVTALTSSTFCLLRLLTDPSSPFPPARADVTSDCMAVVPLATVSVFSTALSGFYGVLVSSISTMSTSSSSMTFFCLFFRGRLRATTASSSS